MDKKDQEYQKHSQEVKQLFKKKLDGTITPEEEKRLTILRNKMGSRSNPKKKIKTPFQSPKAYSEMEQALRDAAQKVYDAHDKYDSTFDRNIFRMAHRTLVRIYKEHKLKRIEPIYLQNLHWKLYEKLLELKGKK